METISRHQTNCYLLAKRSDFSMRRKFLSKTLNKDTYSKEEVHSILKEYEKDLTNEILEEIRGKIKTSLADLELDTNYYFRIDPHIIDSDKKTSFRQALFHKFNENGFFEGQTESSSFVRIFSGAEAKAKEDNPISIINWKVNSEAMYFLFYLVERKVVVDQELYAQKANLFFGIPVNSARSEWSSFKKGDSPKKGKTIEIYVNDALEDVGIR